MNKKILTIIFCLIATVVCLLYSCTADSSTEDVYLFEESVIVEENIVPGEEQQSGEKEINGEAPAEDEYEPEIYDGY